MKKIYSTITLIFIVNIVFSQTPTWSDNIACIVYTHCTSCHNPNGIAPSAYINYQDVLPYRFGIQTAVNNKIMPPYPPDLNYQRYAHEKYLTQQEIDLINQWVNGGAPEGNVGNLPTPPTYASGSQLQLVDLSFKMQPYTNAYTDDNYRSFVIPSNLTTDKFITAWEVIPGNRNMVHHVLVFLDTTGNALALDAADPLPGFQSFGSNNDILIGTWVPGSEPYFLPDGLGVKMYKNADIVLQMHYPAGTIGEKDSTMFNVTFSNNQNLRNIGLISALDHFGTMTNGPLFIPANTVKTFNSEYTSPIDASVFAVLPHMHLVGKSIKSFAVTPQNDTIPFFDIKKWDFKWQGQYIFRKPLIIPQGSKLYAEATYDNTMNNPNQPSNPPKDVALGEKTTDEMMLIYFSFAPYNNGDENIIYDTTSTIGNYNNCIYSELPLSASKHSDFNEIIISPNPANNKLYIEDFRFQFTNITIVDITGKARQVPFENNEINISSLNAGLYFVYLKSEKGEIITQKFIKHN